MRSARRFQRWRHNAKATQAVRAELALEEESWKVPSDCGTCDSQKLTWRHYAGTVQALRLWTAVEVLNSDMWTSHDIDQNFYVRREGLNKHRPGHHKVSQLLQYLGSLGNRREVAPKVRDVSSECCFQMLWRSRCNEGYLKILGPWCTCWILLDCYGIFFSNCFLVWWFGTFFSHILGYIGNNNPNWLSYFFQRGQATTNQFFPWHLALQGHSRRFREICGRSWRWSEELRCQRSWRFSLIVRVWI